MWTERGLGLNTGQSHVHRERGKPAGFGTGERGSELACKATGCDKRLWPHREPGAEPCPELGQGRSQVKRELPGGCGGLAHWKSRPRASLCPSADGPGEPGLEGIRDRRSPSEICPLMEMHWLARPSHCRVSVLEQLLRPGAMQIGHRPPV